MGQRLQGYPSSLVTRHVRELDNHNPCWTKSLLQELLSEQIRHMKIYLISIYYKEGNSQRDYLLRMVSRCQFDLLLAACRNHWVRGIVDFEMIPLRFHSNDISELKHNPFVQQIRHGPFAEGILALAGYSSLFQNTDMQCTLQPRLES